jgi:hypothetical protein
VPRPPLTKLVSRHVVFDESDFPFSISSYAASSEYDTLLEADSVAPSIVLCTTMPPSCCLA